MWKYVMRKCESLEGLKFGRESGKWVILTVRFRKCGSKSVEVLKNWSIQLMY